MEIFNSNSEYILAQGGTVIDVGGVEWMKYQGALIPAAAMPVHVDLSRHDAIEAIKQTDALFLRFTNQPSEHETNWWNVVCRHYDIDKVSSNTRSKIHRGLKRLQINPVEPSWLADNAYDCHVKSYQRYKHASPQTEAEFRRFLLSMQDQPIFEVWSCIKQGHVLGYILCVCEHDGVFMHTIDIAPEGLHDYAAYAMLHCVLEKYVNEKHLAVSNGSRSISHATEMQDFLIKFGFRREYCQLHVVYRPDVAVAVRLLYPFRNILRLFEVIPLAHKISAVLYQEQIHRHSHGHNL
ncbi:hypothetical protein [Kaarinaea lacus]